MNRKQEMILWVGLIVIQLMIVFPPVMRLEQAPEGVEEPPEISVVTNWVSGYGIIVRDYKHIRFVMFAAQLIVVAAITGGFIYTLREKEHTYDGH